MSEFTLVSSPVRPQYQRVQKLNPAQTLRYTTFIPPSITDEQYIIDDGVVGVAIQSAEILDALANGSIVVLGTGRLVVL